MPVPTPVERRRLPYAAIAFVLAIFATIVATIAWRVRISLRDQVLGREGEAVYSVALMQLSAGYGATDPQDDLFNAVLESSRLKGVFAVKLFDAKGVQRKTLPAGMSDETLDPSLLARMALHQPLESLDPSASPESIYGLPKTEDSETVPLLTVFVPLHLPDQTELLGVAQYRIDGSYVEGEFHKVDRQLWIETGTAFGCGAILLVAVLTWAFGQVRKSERAMLAREDDLARANRELAFVAKTSALGAISAHLIHDLKNPLAGLEGFVQDEAAGSNGAGEGEAWKEAVQTARRLRTLVGDVAGLLRDEAGGAFQSLSPAEVGQAAIQRVLTTCVRKDVKISSDIDPDGEAMEGRSANLAVLVLSNLLDNACKASPKGSDVILSVRNEKHHLRFSVTDHGAGLPLSIQNELFLPKTSRPGGGGLGLAISQQLARHAGGEIELVRTGPEGTEFSFILPC